MRLNPPFFQKFEEAETLAVLGATIKRLRKCAGISQEELGETIEVHQAAMCRIEKGLQSIQPWQIQQIAEMFGVSAGELLRGQVNYWRVAERFGRVLPLPARYRDLPYSRVRELMPLLRFLKEAKGSAYFGKLLKSWKVDEAFLQGPDQPIGVHATLDFFRHLLGEKILGRQNIDSLIEFTRTQDIQGFLHPVYQTQTSSLNLLKTLVLNAHHYEQNFDYKMTEKREGVLEVVVSPLEHMKRVDYQGKDLGDILCRYKRAYLCQFPKYIGSRPVQIEELHCLYHGDASCTYRINAA